MNNRLGVSDTDSLEADTIRPSERNRIQLQHIRELGVSSLCLFRPFFSRENYLKRELLGSPLEKLTWRCCPYRLLVGEVAMSQSQAVALHFSISSCSQQVLPSSWQKTLTHVSEYNCVETVGWHDHAQHPSLHWCCLSIWYRSSLGFSCCVCQTHDASRDLLPWVQPRTHLSLWGARRTLLRWWVLLKEPQQPKAECGAKTCKGVLSLKDLEGNEL